MKKKIPTFKTDEEAEQFVETVDLSKYDVSGLKRVKVEFEKKNTQLNVRVPKRLLDGVKMGGRRVMIELV
jgi:predicted DNA binding CopG/RHH family protein